MGIPPPRRHHSLAALASTAFIASALTAAVALAWWTHSAVNFGYPWLYQTLAIDSHIAKYAPQNRYKEGFEATTRDERLRLLGEIVTAVNRRGDGLEGLSYRAGPDDTPTPLLREPEVTHLQAVARLVNRLHLAGGAALGILALSLAVMRQRAIPFGRQAPLGGLVAVLTMALAATGIAFDTREDGWYAWFHNRTFGPDHEWFFVYQESLMTTLLKAPDLFAPLGVSLGATAIAYYILLCALARRLLPQPPS